MEDLVDVRKKQQKMVYFDVGGTVFRVFRDTIQNYPSSLLARLINEFPNLGEETKPLYVDRSPKAFEWILEIYRNGDFASCVPATTRDVLKRELDFYQLPRIADLGLSDLGCFNQQAEAAYRCPGKVLFEALTERKIWDLLPLYVWFYRMSLNRGKEYGKDLVWFSDQPCIYNQLDIAKNETSICLPYHAEQCERESTWLTMTERRADDTCYMIRNPNVPDVCRSLQQSAAEYGICLRLPERSWNTVEISTYGFPPGLIVSLPKRNR